MTSDESETMLAEHHVEMLKQLACGFAVPDRDFDCVFPSEWRRPSSRYWTPVAVAMQVAAWFTRAGAHTVVDLGSGVGKLCIVGALSSKLEFVGVEHRAPLVRAARRAAALLGVDARARFRLSTIDPADLAAFDSFYLYNPFGENLYLGEDCLDATVELSEARFVRDTHIVEGILRAAPMGARVITYYGFGGTMPLSYVTERSARIGAGELRLWVKRPRGSSP